MGMFTGEMVVMKVVISSHCTVAKLGHQINVTRLVGTVNETLEKHVMMRIEMMEMDVHQLVKLNPGMDVLQFQKVSEINVTSVQRIALNVNQYRNVYNQ